MVDEKITCGNRGAGFDRLEDWVRDHRHTWERGLDALGALLDEGDEER